MDTPIVPASQKIHQLLTFRRRLVPSVDKRTVDEFGQAIYDCGFVQNLDWYSHARRLDALESSPKGLASITLEDLVLIFTRHARLARNNSQGFGPIPGTDHLHDLAQSGHLLALLKRLRALVTSGPALTPDIAAAFNAFHAAVESAVPDLLDAPGSSLYSPPDTLRPGPLLILGTNPGDTPTAATATVRENLDHARRNTDRHACLNPDSSGKLSRLNRQLAWCVQRFGLAIRHVPYINLTFTPTPSADDVAYPHDAHRCWPVHEHLLRLVRPRVLLVFGNGDSGPNPYSYLRNHVLASPPSAHEELSGHGDTLIKSFDTTLAGVALTVVGIPHPSRFQLIDSPEASAELSRIAKATGLIS